ncbi:hypothetical protein QR685DRAFT_509155 [Neurospora intermedia]|uniref:Uncharacterized protein n=1 Tax=Neurospora intermedia TaxID=5142 RepID=A0ABR3DNH9_NEUIN
MAYLLNLCLQSAAGMECSWLLSLSLHSGTATVTSTRLFHRLPHSFPHLLRKAPLARRLFANLPTPPLHTLAPDPRGQSTQLFRRMPCSYIWPVLHVLDVPLSPLSDRRQINKAKLVQEDGACDCTHPDFTFRYETPGTTIVFAHDAAYQLHIGSSSVLPGSLVSYCMYNVFVYIAGSMNVIGLLPNWLFSRPHIPSPGRISTRDPFHA